MPEPAPSESGNFRILFREDQQCRDPYLWTFLIFICAILGGWGLRSFVHEAMEGFPHPSLAITSIVLLVTILLPPTLLAVARLQVEVNTNGLFVRFYPLHRKVRQIDLSTVERAEAVIYRPFMEYGGYGIRSLPRAKAYNMRGNQGVRLHYQNGYHLLIGTERPEALRDSIESVRT